MRSATIARGRFWPVFFFDALAKTHHLLNCIVFVLRRQHWRKRLFLPVCLHLFRRMPYFSTVYPVAQIQKSGYPFCLKVDLFCMVRAGAAMTASIKGLKVVGYFDCPGGGQVVVRDGTAYVGHVKPPNSTTIIDVRD